MRTIQGTALPPCYGQSGLHCGHCLQAVSVPHCHHGMSTPTYSYHNHSYHYPQPSLTTLPGAVPTAEGLSGYGMTSPGVSRMMGHDSRSRCPQTIGPGIPSPVTLGRGMPSPGVLGPGMPSPGPRMPSTMTLGSGRPPPVTLGSGRPPPVMLDPGVPSKSIKL